MRITRPTATWSMLAMCPFEQSFAPVPSHQYFPEFDSQLDILPKLPVSDDLQTLLKDDDAMWEEHHEKLLTQLHETSLQLCDDGLRDSPGHCAKYLMYSFLYRDKKIIHMEQVQVKKLSIRKKLASAS
ncbi:uncharacterized protein LOC142768280 [Rhipicephalus microplus]|uniref:uncharacterized protein LOC142768280 n=1 Tax=Rhipicephalus microplus TaxID=6941 RepID=UPI003F6A6240